MIVIATYTRVIYYNIGIILLRDYMYITYSRHNIITWVFVFNYSESECRLNVKTRAVS